MTIFFLFITEENILARFPNVENAYNNFIGKTNVYNWIIMLLAASLSGWF